MDCAKVGNLIKKLRIEKELTQKELADKMNISDKTISKWERGLGCPDVSLLCELSNVLDTNIEEILNGNLQLNNFVNGNMKNSKYYVCPNCNNLILCTGSALVSCCGRKLEELELKKAEEKQKLDIEAIEDEWFVTSNHVMTKNNYISFVAFVTSNSVNIIKQYPEWNLQVRISKREHGMLIWYSLLEGLFYQVI